MDEYEIISNLEFIIAGLPLSAAESYSARHFFDVGEWLLCLEEIVSIVYKRKIVLDDETNRILRIMMDYWPETYDLVNKPGGSI
jgi:hypothetical protein